MKFLLNIIIPIKVGNVKNPEMSISISKHSWKLHLNFCEKKQKKNISKMTKLIMETKQKSYFMQIKMCITFWKKYIKFWRLIIQNNTEEYTLFLSFPFFIHSFLRPCFLSYVLADPYGKTRTTGKNGREDKYIRTTEFETSSLGWYPFKLSFFLSLNISP